MEAMPGALKIPNPLDFESLEGFIEYVTGSVLNLVLAASVLAFIIGAFYFLLAGGDPGKITKAKTIILYAVIGLAIALLAKGLIVLIRSVLGG